MSIINPVAAAIAEEPEIMDLFQEDSSLAQLSQTSPTNRAIVLAMCEDLGYHEDRPDLDDRQAILLCIVERLAMDGVVSSNCVHLKHMHRDERGYWFWDFRVIDRPPTGQMLQSLRRRGWLDATDEEQNTQPGNDHPLKRVIVYVPGEKMYQVSA